MDALALLCTLHADGPATLQRLRAAGCGDLQAIQGLGAAGLGDTLGVPAAAARRLLREARHLAQRLEADLLDREEGARALTEFTGLTGRRPAQAAHPARCTLGPQEADAQPLAQGPPARDRAGQEQALLARVLESWRNLEQEEGAVGVLDPMNCPEQPPVAARDEARAGALRLEDLDAGIAAVLAASGVHSPAQLLRSDLLELARASGIAYTRLRRV